jgi:hypothetical protein
LKGLAVRVGLIRIALVAVVLGLILGVIGSKGVDSRTTLKCLVTLRKIYTASTLLKKR